MVRFQHIDNAPIEPWIRRFAQTRQHRCIPSNPIVATLVKIHRTSPVQLIAIQGIRLHDSQRKQGRCRGNIHPYWNRRLSIAGKHQFPIAPNHIQMSWICFTAFDLPHRARPAGRNFRPFYGTRRFHTVTTPHIVIPNKHPIGIALLQYERRKPTPTFIDPVGTIGRQSDDIILFDGPINVSVNI